MEYIDTLPDKSVIPAVITDIEMPEMSGFTVMRLLRENSETRDVPIIVNSSMTGENNKREAESLGADDFIGKTKSHDILPLVIKVMQSKGIV